ncbi:MAG: hypothetical protein AAF074_15550 [Pseudomonadota bacterium]
MASDVPFLAAIGSGLLYLGSHGLRAVRLALLTAPSLQVSARTAVLLHLVTAPLAVFTPFKLGELARLHQLYLISRRLLTVVILLLVERVLDAALLLLFFAWLLSAGEPLGPAADTLVLVAAAVVLSAAIAFLLGPSALGGVQRYILVYHQRPLARRVLRYVDLARRGVVIGATQLRRQGAQLGFITALIWLMELGAVVLLVAAAFGEGAVAAGALLLSRTMQEWLVIFGGDSEPGVIAAVSINLTALLLAWPACVWLYLGRLEKETHRRRPVMGQPVPQDAPPTVVVILDDRMIPPREIETVLGPVRYSQILRRRRRLADELVEAAGIDGTEIVRVRDDRAARALAIRIADRGAGPVYLRLPTCIAPLRMDLLGPLAEKARYALETMFLCPLAEDEAPMILAHTDAAALLQAESTEARRAVLLRLSEGAPCMVDHLGFTDLRRTRPLLHFLSGSTETRHFNETAAEAGVFRKASSDVAKMRREYRYFHVAPEGTKRFLVPTFAHWEAEGRAGYAMEHMAVPDVALQCIHQAFSEADFALLLDQFFAFIRAREPGEGGRAAARAAWQDQILGKLDTRLDAFAETAEGVALDRILAASGPMGDLAAMRARAAPLLDQARRRDKAEAPVFGHGDPCFSNILFDRRLGLMRLIDPKGADTLEDGMMHPAYDLAKFSHSALGGYDFINNDLFSCPLDERQKLGLKLDQGGPPSWMGEAFAARLDTAGFDRFVVRAVELTLFLSMLPLHTDHPRKLSGYVLVASGIIEELERSA